MPRTANKPLRKWKEQEREEAKGKHGEREKNREGKKEEGSEIYSRYSNKIREDTGVGGTNYRRKPAKAQGRRRCR